jgi:hypothetical protein
MSAPLSDDQIFEISSSAMARNEAMGVSGILFCMNDRFIQVLEGESDVVGDLYERIAADPRHHDVITILDGPLDARAFANWSMRLVGEDDLSPSEQAIIIQALRSVEPSAAHALRRPTMGALLAGPLGPVVARGFRVPPDDAEAMEIADRLLQSAEDLMSESGPEATFTLEQIARHAEIGDVARRVCFRDIDEIIQAGARRALAIELLSFIEVMSTRRFERRADVALAIVAAVLISNAERDGLTASVDRQIRRQSFEVICESARAIADAIHEARPREGELHYDLAPTEIAAALTATAAAAKALIDYDPAALGRPRNQDWLLQISLAALGHPAG